MDKCGCLRRAEQIAKDSCNFVRQIIFFRKPLLVDKEASNEIETKIISMGS